MSNINPILNYDRNFPKPGINQSSEQFRKNFSSIQKNFEIAKSEIYELQNKEIVISSNDLENSIINFSDNNVEVNLKENLEFRGNSIVIPSGLTLDRPATNKPHIRYNSNTLRLEMKENNIWYDMNAIHNFVSNTGGNISGTLTTNALNTNQLNSNNVSTNDISLDYSQITSVMKSNNINNGWYSLGFIDLNTISNATASIEANLTFKGSTFYSIGKFYMVFHFDGSLINSNSMVQHYHEIITVSNTIEVLTRLNLIGYHLHLETYLLNTLNENFDVFGMISMNKDNANLRFN